MGGASNLSPTLDEMGGAYNLQVSMKWAELVIAQVYLDWAEPITPVF